MARVIANGRNRRCLPRAVLCAALALAPSVPLIAHPTSNEATAVFTRFRYEGRQPAHRHLLNPGEYRNPIIQGSYSDPTIIRVGSDYYLSNASFTLFPGPPIFHSRDLVHWRQIGSVLTRADQAPMTGLDTWQGIYAPALAYRDATFYLITTCQGCGGNFISTATRPEGPWSDPHWLPFAGIDPSLFFDDDGRAWVVNNGPPEGAPRWDGHRAIWLQEIDLHTFTMVGPRSVIVDGGAHPAQRPFWIEGPHLFRHDGAYYLICAEGGTKERHHEVAFRAEHLRGPWRAAPRPILSQLDLDPARPDPVVQAGHADMVRTPAGDWWAVFLASRPWGPGELDYNTGRETFLLPVRWTDGWPVILPPGTPVPAATTAPKLAPSPTGEPHGGDYVVADDWTGAGLQPRWAMLGTPATTWWRTGQGLMLEARTAPLGGTAQPSFLGLRQQHMNAVASVRVAFQPRTAGERAGLVAYQGVRRFLALSVTTGARGGRAVRLDRMAGDEDAPSGTPVATAPLPSGASPVDLRMEVAGPRYAFSYRTGGGRWRRVGAVQDGSILGTTSAKGFTGVLIGPFADVAAR